MSPARALRGPAGLLAGLLITLPGCGDRPVVAQARAPDVVLLVGADTFAGGNRVAQLLADATSASDVLGPARFEVLAVPGGSPAELAARLLERLARAADVRAVVAVLGDLTALTGIDPSERLPERRELSSREPRIAEVLAARRAMADDARAAGAVFLAATAPLGRQGRVEVPELLDVARALGEAGPVVDLQSGFLARADEPLFTNGIDRLDDYGHDELAREVLPALLAALPPRDEDERIARLQALALEHFAQGREADWRALLPEVQAAPARTPRAAVRRAALLSAADGLLAHTADWAAIDPGAETDVPGLLTARLMLHLPTGSLPARDPMELGFQAVTQAVAEGSPRAADLAAALVDAYPERLEAWLALQLVGAGVGPPRDCRGMARRTLRLFDHGALSVTQAERLLDDWPAALNALPALVCASRATAGQLPVGPLLATARRGAALGLKPYAATVLRSIKDKRRLPPSWHELADAWAPP